jgi:preprotein translocase subunit SecA
LKTPSDIYRRISAPPARKFHKGLDGVVHGWLGGWERRGSARAKLLADAEEATRLSIAWEKATDADLRDALRGHQESFRRGGAGAEAALIPALGALREAAFRCVGLRPYPVQLAGALALHRGFLAEMATGEGKTLTAGLAGVLAGWLGRPCHVITVNDYLVQRDSDWMRPLYAFCGLKVAFVTGTMPPDNRQRAYLADVVYVTSKELLADFLRDRIRLAGLHNPERWGIRRLLQPRTAIEAGLVQRGLHTAIVDEADSVLIDEAVTPLIISAPKPNNMLSQAVELAAHLAESLSPDEDYKIDLRYGEVEFTDAGKAKVEERCGLLPGFWRGNTRREELLRQALIAREFYLRDKQYIISDGKVSIVDEFTGRAMPQRSWREGLHQAIEAKEGVDMTNPAETIARMSFQRFFRLFPRLSGMTGTAWEAADEFWRIYHLPVVRIPTNRPCVRQDMPDRVFATEALKWDAVVAEIQRLHASGRPVLVGTRSVRASEALSHRLFEIGVSHRLLNASRHSEEAAIVSKAGEAGQVTLATNMAGRGTDIRLGPGVAEAGGLHVVATERHESGRVDRQLYGRAARQGDPGCAQTFVSLEDELLVKHLKPGLRRTARSAFQGGLPAGELLARQAFSLAQRNAQKLAFRRRREVLRVDTWLDESLSFAGTGV